MGPDLESGFPTKWKHVLDRLHVFALAYVLGGVQPDCLIAALLSHARNMAMTASVCLNHTCMPQPLGQRLY